ncbi:MAG: hypothetical protein WA735_21340 [Candidatus Acidiferrales bacterium]
MDESHSRAHETWQIPVPSRASGRTIQYLLKAERRILESISARTPLLEILNEIGSALDCQIANVASLISLPSRDTGESVTNDMNAALFGLYTFCSASLVGANRELLGSLKIYCGTPHSPSLEEFQLIEQAGGLAAIAIEHDVKAGHRGGLRVHGKRPMRGRVLEWPISTG